MNYNLAKSLVNYNLANVYMQPTAKPTNLLNTQNIVLYTPYEHKGSEQPAHVHCLIRDFAVHTHQESIFGCHQHLDSLPTCLRNFKLKPQNYTLFRIILCHFHILLCMLVRSDPGLQKYTPFQVQTDSFLRLVHISVGLDLYCTPFQGEIDVLHCHIQ